MFVLHFDAQVQSFPTLRRAVNYLADVSRHAVQPQCVYIVDTKATANYTAPHPSDKKKPAIFVRGNPTLADRKLDQCTLLELCEHVRCRPLDSQSFVGETLTPEIVEEAFVATSASVLSKLCEPTPPPRMPKDTKFYPVPPEVLKIWCGE